jgi:predicted nucleic-acid-binding Zn-ribbon protein
MEIRMKANINTTMIAQLINEGTGGKQKVCPKCGKHNMEVLLEGRNDDEAPAILSLYNPSSPIGNGSARVNFYVAICQDCGFSELYPEAMLLSKLLNYRVSY